MTQFLSDTDFHYINACISFYVDKTRKLIYYLKPLHLHLGVPRKWSILWDRVELSQAQTPTMTSLFLNFKQIALKMLMCTVNADVCS